MNTQVNRISFEVLLISNMSYPVAVGILSTALRLRLYTSLRTTHLLDVTCLDPSIDLPHAQEIRSDPSIGPSPFLHVCLHVSRSNDPYSKSRHRPSGNLGIVPPVPSIVPDFNPSLIPVSNFSDQLLLVLYRLHINSV